MNYKCFDMICRPPSCRPVLPTAQLSCQTPPYPANRPTIQPTAALSSQPPPYPANRRPLQIERLRENLADFDEQYFENMHQNRLDGPISSNRTVTFSISIFFLLKPAKVFPVTALYQVSSETFPPFLFFFFFFITLKPRVE